MLEPRPEIRTATLTLSAMKARAPGAAAEPDLRRAEDGAAALALDHFADAQHRLARLGEDPLHLGRFGRRDDRDHADAAVEGARHLGGLDIPLRLQEGHERRLRPGSGVDAGVEPVRQHAWYVLEQAAASD